MAGLKQEVTFQVQQDLLNMLDKAASTYGLASRDKALRCILDYVADAGDWEEIFSTVRCLRCGRRPGWTGADTSPS